MAARENEDFLRDAYAHIMQTLLTSFKSIFVTTIGISNYAKISFLFETKRNKVFQFELIIGKFFQYILIFVFFDDEVVT